MHVRQARWSSVRACLPSAKVMAASRVPRTPDEIGPLLTSMWPALASMKLTFWNALAKQPGSPPRRARGYEPGPRTRFRARAAQRTTCSMCVQISGAGSRFLRPLEETWCGGGRGRGRRRQPPGGGRAGATSGPKAAWPRATPLQIARRRLGFLGRRRRRPLASLRDTGESVGTPRSYLLPTRAAGGCGGLFLCSSPDPGL